MESKVLSDKFEDTWDRLATKGQSPNQLFKVLYAILGRYFLISGLQHVIAGAALQLTPFAMKYFLQTMESHCKGTLPADQVWLGYAGAFLMFFLLLVKTILGNQGYFGAYKAGLKIRSSLSSAIYYHLLEMSNSAKQVRPLGSVSADIFRFTLWERL